MQNKPTTLESGLMSLPNELQGQIISYLVQTELPIMFNRQPSNGNHLILITPHGSKLRVPHPVLLFHCTQHLFNTAMERFYQLNTIRIETYPGYLDDFYLRPHIRNLEMLIEMVDDIRPSDSGVSDVWSRQLQLAIDKIRLLVPLPGLLPGLQTVTVTVKIDCFLTNLADYHSIGLPYAQRIARLETVTRLVELLMSTRLHGRSREIRKYFQLQFRPASDGLKPVDVNGQGKTAGELSRELLDSLDYRIFFDSSGNRRSSPEMIPASGYVGKFVRLD